MPEHAEDYEAVRCGTMTLYVARGIRWDVMPKSPYLVINVEGAGVWPIAIGPL